MILCVRHSSLLAVPVCLLLATMAHGGDDPYADEVVSFFGGVNPAPGYADPTSTLGEPERFSGEEIFPSVVSPFSPAFGLDEIVSIGASGWITLRFDTPITDDPNNLYGIDLLVFGNTGFVDLEWPSAIVDGIFPPEGGLIEVSADGKDWFPVSAVIADGPFPTLGYLDAGAYDGKPGAIESDFTRPVDPALQLSHFMGLGNAGVVELYRGSGGGAGIDLASTGLAEVSYVRIYNPNDSGENFEIDAVSDVAPRLAGDVDLNGVVDIDDMFEVIAAWGKTTPGSPPADFDLSGFVDIDDLFTVITNWTQ